MRAGDGDEAFGLAALHFREGSEIADREPDRGFLDGGFQRLALQTRLARQRIFLGAVDQAHPGSDKIAGRVEFRIEIGLHAAALRMAHDDDMRHGQPDQGELHRSRRAVMPAVRAERRNDVGDVPEHEQLARPGRKDRLRRHAAVAAADDERLRRLTEGGELGEAAFFLRQPRFAPEPVAVLERFGKHAYSLLRAW